MHSLFLAVDARKCIYGQGGKGGDSSIFTSMHAKCTVLNGDTSGQQIFTNTMCAKNFIDK
jgi:hypothetical protein